MAKIERQIGAAALDAQDTTDPEATTARHRTARGTLSTSTIRYATGESFFMLYVTCEVTGALVNLTINEGEASNLSRNLLTFLDNHAIERRMGVSESFVDSEDFQDETTMPDESSTTLRRGSRYDSHNYT